MLKLAHWFKEVEEYGFKSFSVLMKTTMNHYNDILNYFDHEALMFLQNHLILQLKTSDYNFGELKTKRFSYSDDPKF